MNLRLAWSVWQVPGLSVALSQTNECMYVRAHTHTPQNKNNNNKNCWGKRGYSSNSKLGWAQGSLSPRPLSLTSRMMVVEMVMPKSQTQVA